MVQGKIYQGVKKMRKDEITRKNIGLTFDFIRAAVADPHLLNKIPDGAEIDFLETDLPRIETEERDDKRNTSVLFKVERNFQRI
jgi:hypothetical protein